MKQPSASCLQVEELSDITIVGFLSRRIVDEEDVLAVGDQLHDLASRRGRNRILLDFGNVRAMSSGLLARLVVLNRRITLAEGKLGLYGLATGVHEIFRITRLDRSFEIYEDEGDAITQF